MTDLNNTEKTDAKFSAISASAKRAVKCGKENQL
jgi:hypothetical protein